MGRAWARLLKESPLAEPVGVVDLDTDAARAAAEELGLPDPDASSAPSLTALVDRLPAERRPEAVVDVTVPVAHLPVTLEALGLGLPVLGEKPLAASLAEAHRLVRAAEEAGQLFMVSQNRRYKRGLWRLKSRAGALGGAGILLHEFSKAIHFGGFRETMAHPLLSDMAIHNFDAARFLLDADPVAVYCEEYNPEWSWFGGDAACTAIFEMSGGARFVYTGSWCSPGLETPWDSRWRVSAPRGSAVWCDGGPGEDGVVTEAVEGAAPDPAADALPPDVDLAGSLSDFVAALRSGEAPMTAARDNLLSLAMVEAAAESAGRGARVRIAETVESAAAEAAAAA
ncbi:hypothetical protein BIV57_06610 [Mangrovactinospora gilvigrisea]|uniref:Oxidoreductase n=2 Tax=Mangrovactinospora gilvigrisea TaxID=1428644 RepID=A0A1J7BIB1_9ACTN|nr:hypothetical protein BIV57_06610 [Mangrovactinospora gilvigrisea]